MRQGRSVSSKSVMRQKASSVCRDGGFGGGGGVIRENRSKVAGLLQDTVIQETKLHCGGLLAHPVLPVEKFKIYYIVC